MFVGHDWGSMVVWQMALLHPDRVAGVVGMSVPFMPRSPMPPVQMMRQIFGDNFFYIVYFQDPGVADADLGRDAADDDASDARRGQGRRRRARPISPQFAAPDGAGSSTVCRRSTSCPSG